MPADEDSCLTEVIKLCDSNVFKLVFNSSASAEKSNKVGINMYYRGLKFVILGLKILLILQSVHKVKLYMSSSMFLVGSHRISG